VLRGGEPVFTRTISHGTEGLPQTASRLAREIRLTLAAYRAAGGLPPTRLLLCGGGAFVSGAETFLANELEMKVDVLPAPVIEVEAPAVERVLEMPRFAKAIGLAVGLASGRPMGLDLRRGPLVYERGFGWLREKIPVVAGLGAVIAVSFLFSACAQLYATGKEQTTLENALATVSKDVLGEKTSDPDRAQALLTKLASGADEDPMPHADAFDVMVKISEAIPESMTHDIEELDVQKGHVVVRGIVGSIPDAQSIATTLRNETCFDDVKITRTNQVVGGERQKYVLEFDLKCPEDKKPGAKKPGSSAASGSASAAASSGGGK
jgi:general secretion pathway protein L